jgi:cytoskeleton protein RodZ
MSEQDAVDGSAAADAPSAGAMLRAARERRGMHIAVLAAAIKVPQRKLEALEADRYDELPDMTFTRALAQSVCRTLKVDMQPVLDRLPQTTVASPKLEHVGMGLNAPFRERPGRDEPTDWSWLRKPVVWGTLIVLLGAAALAFLPERWLGSVLRGRAPATAPSASAPAVSEVLTLPASAVPSSASDASPTVEPPVPAASMPAPAATPSATTAAPLAVPSTLALSAGAESWIEVQDARGQMLLSRSLSAGESVAVDGTLPLRVTIGNATATQLSFRGNAVDLARHTRDNVARLQLN